MANTKDLEIRIKSKVENANSLKTLSDVLKEIARAMKDIKGAEAQSSAMMKKYTSAALQATQKLNKLNTAKKRSSSIDMTLVKGSQAHISQLRRLQKNLDVNSKRFQVLQAGIKRYSKALRDARTSNKFFNRGMLEMYENITTVVTGIVRVVSSLLRYGRVALGVAKTVVDAFAKQELSVTKLRSVLKLTGSEGSFQTLVDQAAQLQKVTIFADEDIINAQAMLGTFKLNTEQIKLLTPALVSMGTSLQQMGRGEQDLQTLAIQIGKVAGTELISSLTRMGVVMDKTQQENLRLASGMEKTKLLVEILNQNYGTLATDGGKTLFAQMEQLNHAWGDMQEAIGQILATALAPLMIVVKKTIELLAELLKSVADVYTELVNLTRGVFTSEESFKQFGAEVLKFIKDAWNWFLEKIKEFFPYAKLLAIEIKKLIKELGDAGLLGIIKLVVKIGFVNLMWAIKNVIKGLTLVVGIIKRVVENFKTLLSMIGKVFNAMSRQPSNSLLGGIANAVQWVGDKIAWVLKMLGKLTGTSMSVNKEATKGTLSVTETIPTEPTTKTSGTGKTQKEEVEKISKEEQNLLDIKANQLYLDGKILETVKQTVDATSKYVTQAGDYVLDLQMSESQLNEWLESLKDDPTIMDAVRESVTALGDSLSGLFTGLIQGGENAMDALKETMKTIVNTFITSIQAMILAATGGMFAKAITTFGISLITDAPWLALA